MLSALVRPARRASRSRACERDMRDMYDQAKPHPDAAAPRFADGRDPRPAPPDAVARTSGVLAASSSGRSAAHHESALIARASGSRPRALRHLSARHATVRPATATAWSCAAVFHVRRVSTPTRSVRSRMRGSKRRSSMASARCGRWADRIDADDRAAIVAYVRALQHSQHVEANTLDAASRALLDRSAR